MEGRKAIIDEMRHLKLIEGVDYYEALYDLIESHTKPLHAIEVIDRAVDVVDKAMRNHGYLDTRAIEALDQLKQEYRRGE